MGIQIPLAQSGLTPEQYYNMYSPNGYLKLFNSSSNTTFYRVFISDSADSFAYRITRNLALTINPNIGNAVDYILLASNNYQAIFKAIDKGVDRNNYVTWHVYQKSLNAMTIGTRDFYSVVDLQGTVGTEYITTSYYGIYDDVVYSDINSLVTAILNDGIIPIASSYPITYRLTNCTASSAPVEALVGETVNVTFSFSDGYGFINPSTDVYVMNNGVLVPSNYSNGVLSFTMPDPS